MLKTKVEHSRWRGRHVPRTGGETTCSVARWARPGRSLEAGRRWEDKREGDGMSQAAGPKGGGVGGLDASSQTAVWGRNGMRWASELAWEVLSSSSQASVFSPMQRMRHQKTTHTAVQYSDWVKNESGVSALVLLSLHVPPWLVLSETGSCTGRKLSMPPGLTVSS